jgi:hypothetical protein
VSVRHLNALFIKRSVQNYDGVDRNHAKQKTIQKVHFQLKIKNNHDGNIKNPITYA